MNVESGDSDQRICTKINMGPGFSPQVLSSEVGPAEEHQGGSRRGIIIYNINWEPVRVWYRIT